MENKNNPRVVWLFPPSDDGFPNVSQYRFYKKMPIRASIIYPYIASVGATLLFKDGFDVRFMDCPTMKLSWDDVDYEIKDADLVVLEGRTPLIHQTWSTIKRIRFVNPKVRIAVYGDHVSWDPNETLSKGADFIVKGGDYDWGVYSLARELKGNPSVSTGERDYGLVEDLSSLPWADRSLVPWSLYYETWRARKNFVWSMGMRGCYYRCVYCAWSDTFWKRKIRYRDPKEYTEEISSLVRQLGDIELLDDSDLFELGSWGWEFAKHLWREGLFQKKVLWSVQTHPREVVRAKDHLEFLKKSGLRVVKLGVESGIDRSLAMMRKGSSRDLIEKAVDLLKQHGIMVHANMMLGFPWETEWDVMDSLNWIKKLDPNQAQFSLVIPYPNTELYDMALENDWFLQDPLDWSLFDASYPMLKMEGLSGDDIVDLYRKMWSSFYLNRKYIWSHLKTVRHLEGVKHLWRGFRSVRFGHMKAIGKKRGN